MGIPGLNKAIGSSDRIALSRLAVKHLEATRRPIRIAVDISIWLFQLQAGRGGHNPELRTLFFRLVRLLALPVHPLFVYDGKQKPPFKRGKATTGRSYGSAPIIGLSKILIDLFKFPRHDAPGEAEAECARLQQAGVVDAVMSNDIDTLMFGSTLTVMNFSKEGSTGTTAATHVDCYTTESRLGVEGNVNLSRAGMVLFAMLSGGDYLPSGVPKCGPSLAGEIAKAGFGEDLFEIVYSLESEIKEKLDEWRDRLQYELDENESGYFQSKHKAVRIPESFPDSQILAFYAKPLVSNDTEIENVRRRLTDAWDHEIDVLELRKFVAEFFDWKYRSGARKLVRNIAEPLLLTRLRLGRPPIAPHGYGSYIPNQDIPILQRAYRSRMHFITGGTPQLQVEMIPLDVVGLDLGAEEPNPPPESSQIMQPGSQATEAGDDEEDSAAEAEPSVKTPLGIQLPKKIYNPSEPEKIWVFEAVARLGIPKVVEQWKKQEEEKKAPKKPKPKKTATTARKKKVIDPSMKPGGIIRFTTVTKPGSGMNADKQAYLLDASTSSSSQTQPSSHYSSQAAPETPSKMGTYSSGTSRRFHNVLKTPLVSGEDLVHQFSMACSLTGGGTLRRTSPRFTTGRPVLGSAEYPIRLDLDDDFDTCDTSPLSRIKVSYTNAGSPPPLAMAPPSHVESPQPRRSRRVKVQPESKSLQCEDPEALSRRLSSPSRKSGRIPKSLVRQPEGQNVIPEPVCTPLLSSLPKTLSADDDSPPEAVPKPRTEIVEKIRTENGFWTVEISEEEVTCSSKNNSADKDGKEDDQKPKKKRIGRVSLLDLS
ncbi:Flap endonuclease GEN homolog 1 [Talaromyces islandicus]|uniref:Flap endonuclease GEN homolog 1 n=1 Tax=Talaromyces islandicus TaxID=28573 RepID=A0A0U1MC16_TALIS|nr:Flap endonuclease GEN homolog 1 [Talaromyces islandicus]